MPWDAPQPLVCNRQEQTAEQKRLGHRGDLNIVPLTANTAGLGLLQSPIEWATTHATVPVTGR